MKYRFKKFGLGIILALVVFGLASCGTIEKKITHRDIVSWALAIYNGENDRVLSIILKPGLPEETMKAIQADVRNLKPEHIRTDLPPETARAIHKDLDILIQLKPLLDAAGKLVLAGEAPSIAMENEIITLVRMISNKFLVEGGG